MARIIITNPAPFKRIFHDRTTGRAHRVCRKCGAHVLGHNRGVCSRCLRKGGTDNVR